MLRDESKILLSVIEINNLTSGEIYSMMGRFFFLLSQMLYFVVVVVFVVVDHTHEPV